MAAPNFRQMRKLELMQEIILMRTRRSPKGKRGGQGSDVLLENLGKLSRERLIEAAEDNYRGKQRKQS